MRAEFAALLDTISAHGLLDGKCLQLGLGQGGASHAVWKMLFREVYSIDRQYHYVEGEQFMADTHSRDAYNFAFARKPYDLLFIDAGHTMPDYIKDFGDFGPMVAPGGIVAVHDACKRPGYELEIQTWRWLNELGNPFKIIGTEVGIAWMRV